MVPAYLSPGVLSPRAMLQGAAELLMDDNATAEAPRPGTSLNRPMTKGRHDQSIRPMTRCAIRCFVGLRYTREGVWASPSCFILRSMSYEGGRGYSDLAMHAGGTF